MLEYIKLSSLRDGDVLGRAVYDAKGMVLATQGMSMTTRVIEALKAQGFKGVYIDRKSTEARDTVHIQEPIIDDYTTIKVVNIITHIIANKKIFSNAWDSNFTADRKLIEDYIDEFYTEFSKRNISNELIFEMEDGRTNANWLEFHSFNTMQIAMAIALRLNYPAAVVKEIGIGALMHDIGKAKFPELINKKHLTEAEKETMRTHPRVIFDVLTQLSGSYSSTHCTYACWQSHEVFDGSGYPMCIGGQKVTPFGYIVGIASRFDNLVHIMPFNEAPMSNNDALEMIMGSNKYPVDITKALTEVVAAFPIGVKVMLSNNETAIVLKNTVSYPLRPEILVGYHRINLARDDNYRNVTITRTIEE